MPENRETGSPVPNSPSQSNTENRPEGSTHDPELEMPDPEQVERDIEQAQRIFGHDRPASDKPGKAA